MAAEPICCDRAGGMMTDQTAKKQVILAAYFPGVNNTTVWADERAGSQIDFSSFIHLAQTAERGKLDFFFLAEGLRLREQRGRIHDLDVVGRPDTLTVLAALASVTSRLGLAGTLNSTYREPYELARQLATLDHLSGGRAAWNVVTSSDAFTGENFRRGGFLPHSERYTRAREFVETARELWDSWAADEIVADATTGTFLRTGSPGEFAHHGPQFDIAGNFNVPRSPQVHPVILQAGDSDEGREFAASSADIIFSRHSQFNDARAFYEDVKGRLAAYGRERGELKILPGVTFVLGSTRDEALERARHIRRQQVSPQTAILIAEQLWNRDLSDYDPEGPLPAVEPDLSPDTIIKGRAPIFRDPVAVVAKWREIAAAKGLGLRDVVIETTGRHTFVGTPADVAESMDDFVQRDGSDGFVLAPHLTPSGIDDFVDLVVPLLQERGVLRTEYTTTTFRGHLGLPAARSRSFHHSAVHSREEV
jgi:FMN-dependent oxidoreductase (nitrilotriacetate monooxygenase family)